MTLASLYLEDRAAWLEENARLLRSRRDEKVDWPNLTRYLKSWAEADRRDVRRMLTRLLLHRIKWDSCPEWRTRKRAGELVRQAQDLEIWLESKTLKDYARAILAEAYSKARRNVVIQPNVKAQRRPQDCPYTLAALLGNRTYQLVKRDLKKEG